MESPHPPPQIAALWEAAARYVEECLDDLRRLPESAEEPLDTKPLCERLKAVSLAVSCLKQIQDGQRKSSQETNDASNAPEGDGDLSQQFAQRIDSLLEAMQGEIGAEDARGDSQDPCPA